MIAAVAPSGTPARHAIATVAPIATSTGAMPRAIHAWPRSDAIQPPPRRRSQRADQHHEADRPYLARPAASPIPVASRISAPPIGSTACRDHGDQHEHDIPGSTITAIRAHANRAPPTAQRVEHRDQEHRVVGTRNSIQPDSSHNVSVTTRRGQISAPGAQRGAMGLGDEHRVRDAQARRSPPSGQGGAGPSPRSIAALGRPRRCSIIRARAAASDPARRRPASRSGRRQALHTRRWLPRRRHRRDSASAHQCSRGRSVHVILRRPWARP